MSVATDRNTDEVVDLVFALSGHALVEDYAELLWQGLRASLPWLDEDEAAAVHPLARTSPGQGERYLSKHSRLTLRIAAGRVEQARVLCGRQLDLGSPVAVGAAVVRTLEPAKELHSGFVALGLADEVAFLAACRRQLDGVGIGMAHLVTGKARRMQVAGRQVEGFGLMLHGLGKEDALRLQRAGLGEERKRGCGIFVPHKAVAAVGD